MPEISRFYGIVIKMFFKPKEHEPSHIHALYWFENTWNDKWWFTIKSSKFSKRMVKHTWSRTSKNVGYSNYREISTIGVEYDSKN